MHLAASHHEPIELPQEFWAELMPVAPAASRGTSTESVRGMISALMLEVLNGAFMAFRRLAGRKGAKVLPTA